MLRVSPNWRVIRVDPTWLDEVISVTSAMTPRWRSSGVATVVAIVSGLAPGICANTEIVGKSICGNGDTGSLKNAKMPASATPMVNRVVATGRSMNGVERLTGGSRASSWTNSLGRVLGIDEAAETPAHRAAEAVETE